MEHSIFIANIILSMREYQKENNIRKHCITNVFYLYCIIKRITNININMKAKAVYVCANNEEDTFIFVGGHIVLELGDGTIIEPSYDIFSLKNVAYYDNIKDYYNNIKDVVDITKVDIKNIVDNNIYFMDIAKRINNGELIISDEKYYDKQADYIEKIIYK